MRKTTWLIVTALSVAVFSAVGIPIKAGATAAATVGSPYLFNFNTSGTLHEAANSPLSSSAYWWMNSGGYLKVELGQGKTPQGSLAASDPWRIQYAASNPVDTDNGFHPQNIFRLVTRNTWQNAEQEAYFVIKADNLSQSPNRNASNGLLFFNRYQDGDNLYYTGIRVDGTAIIKKKYGGNYYTLASVKNIYPGTYDRAAAPNLLPKNKWIGLRSQVVNQSDGSVSIKLYLDKGWSGSWQLIASAIDNGSTYGPAITKAGFGGMRTDFMDVIFENFRFKKL